MTELCLFKYQHDFLCFKNDLRFMNEVRLQIPRRVENGTGFDYRNFLVLSESPASLRSILTVFTASPWAGWQLYR